MAMCLKLINPVKIGQRCISTSPGFNKSHSCKLLVVGGGSGGCSTAAKFVPKFKKNEVIIVDPCDKHYYQPMFTLVGGGMKKLSETWRPMGSVLPKNALWIQDSISSFHPSSNTVKTENGDVINYEYMIVALGISMHFENIKGLTEALSNPHSNVCSNYSPLYVDRTFDTLKKFKEGNAIFTFPNSPVKCAGAPQKACYISEHYFDKCGKRSKANMIYKTTLPVIFAVKKYANSLTEVCKKRNINVDFREELIEVKSGSKEAVFKNLDKPDEIKTIDYEMLHVTPPMGPPTVLKTAPELLDQAGYLNVNKETLQHVKFKNIFGIGDCTNLPTSKTAAAVAGQGGVLFQNLYSLMQKGSLDCKYNGYTSCPLVTGYKSCILAEFDYNQQPLETFPINQGIERYSMFLMKKDIMPFIYWKLMLNGMWDGPQVFRKILHLGLK
uniref:Sulfide:quinone oxidoreductase, mitochondrial n=1 Tax=Clastoptera arizonana TaxID=38151 RepID=A0A1B6EDK7_9HEMI